MPFACFARHHGIGLAALVVSAVAAAPALAQTAAQWPDRPVRLLVPVGAGGVADTLSRTLSNAFAQFANGQPLIVENRPGGGGTIAAAAVVREKPDGYTLFLTDIGPNAVSHLLMSKLPYDPHTAFTPIVHVANLPAAMLIRPTLPYKTLAEFIAAAKQQPGKFNYATAGMGNWTHLFMAYLNSRAGIDQVNVIYRSGAEMLTALLKDEADTAMISVSTSIGQVREGKVRALAVGSLQPMPQLPDTPPAAQTIPGLEFGVWHGIAAPAGMEPALATRINAVFNQVLQVPAVRTTITGPSAGNIIGGTPQQFDTFIKSELKRWPEVVKATGIKPE
jgi:tripartite-type tricarboxylate transporter receptor subunit TctC